MQSIAFRSQKARREVVRGITIFLVLFLPQIVFFIGGCSGGSSAPATCKYIPDAIGDAVVDLELYILLAGGAWILVLWVLGFLYACMLVTVGIADEYTVRTETQD